MKPGETIGVPVADVVGIDHVYLTVRALDVAAAFYDVVLRDTLGFRKSDFTLGGDPHLQYYNRHFGVVVRPAHVGTAAHDPYAPGLHHLCLRVESSADVDRVAATLASRGIVASAPRLFPQYAPDYYATFLVDPDGIRLEVTNFRAERRARMAHWADVDARGLLSQAYAAFNRRDVDAALATMHSDVTWPNGMEGGVVEGHEAVRAYWTRQWGMIDPRVEPRGFSVDDAGRTVVDVHQVVRDLAGAVQSDEMLQHVYRVERGLIRSMEIRKGGDG